MIASSTSGSFAYSARPGTSEADNLLAYGGASGPALFQFNATGPLTVSADGSGLSTTAWNYYSFHDIAYFLCRFSIF